MGKKLSDDSLDLGTRTTLQTVLFVANEIKLERAIQLPTIAKIFLKSYDPTGTKNNVIEVDQGTVCFTSRWLLTQLILHLNSHIEFKCVHRKFGTVIFRKGGNLMTSLSWALGRSHIRNSTTNLELGGKPNENEEAILSKAGDIINDLLHSEIKQQTKYETFINDTNRQLNINELISKTDSSLWQFITSATRTKRQRERTGNTEKDKIMHVKKHRRFYCMCALMYCANSQNPTTLHIFLTDIVETCGGSRMLIKLLNQFGVVASTDTHDRFVKNKGKAAYGIYFQRMFSQLQV